MKPWLIALAVARALDVTSTCQGIAAGNIEANPLLPNACAAQVGLHSGIAVGQIAALALLHRTHPKLALVLGLVSISVETGAAVHNWRIR